MLDSLLLLFKDKYVIIIYNEKKEKRRYKVMLLKRKDKDGKWTAIESPITKKLSVDKDISIELKKQKPLKKINGKWTENY